VIHNNVSPLQIYIYMANYPILLNIIYFMHTVLVIVDVSYGRNQIVTLKSFVLFGGRACDVWGLPFQTHGVLLPLLSQCLPVLDEICRRSLNFVRSSIRYESAFVQFIDCTLVVVHVLDGM